MNCEICFLDSGETTVILPIKQPDGKLDTFACLTCSVASGVYCEAHQRPHLGFTDDTTACLDCIEDVVREDGEKIAGQMAIGISRSPRRPEIEGRINQWWARVKEELVAPSLGEMGVINRVAEVSRAENIARLVVTKAFRMKNSPGKIIEQISKQGPAIILPPEMDL